MRRHETEEAQASEGGGVERAAAAPAVHPARHPMAGLGRTRLTRKASPEERRVGTGAPHPAHARHTHPTTTTKHMPTTDENPPTAPSVKLAECVIITAPEWFEREDFRAWLDGPQRPATWHKEGEEAYEYADVFVTFDGGANPGPAGENYEGSDFGGAGEAALPEDIEAAIKLTLASLHVTWGVVRISPV